MLGGAAGIAGALVVRGAAAQTPAEDLRIIAYETMYGLDAVHEFSAQYLRGVGAAEALLRVTPQAEVEPEIASGVEMLEPTRWEVRLRPEVSFWSGAPVDAGAVVAALERSRALAPVAAGLLRGVRIEPADDHTVTFTADTPIPGLPLALADVWLTIHNAAAAGPQDNAFEIGAADYTGPFRVSTWEPRVRTVLERNERYWGVRPRIRRVLLDEVPDIEARTLAALSGEAHIVRWVSSESAARVDRSRSMRLVPAPNVSTTSVYLNTQRAPFDDVRVRQALAWAADREELVAVALSGHGSVVPSWLGANPAYPEAKRAGYTRYDATRAGQLLEEAGWRVPAGGRTRLKDGQPLKFRLAWWGGGRLQAEVLQGQWEKIGAQVEVQGSADYGFLQAARARNDWDAFIEGWGTFGDPQAVLSRHVSPAGDINYAKFRDSQLESLLDGFAGLLDAEARRQQALQVNARQAELVPFIPLMVSTRLNAVHRDVRNYVPHFLGWAYEVHPDLWVAV